MENQNKRKLKEIVGGGGVKMVHKWYVHNHQEKIEEVEYYELVFTPFTWVTAMTKKLRREKRILQKG